ncbi:4300_t:CDS:2 [Paraglomus occultum]|uniref:4300_t:CDS:1 n=1 Tax=Paraglomus occultum TaxID=144539 RepID=A0A9N9ASJ5_9GLOM|nr:4300_t:CDS:2 [Paraglomus occultum]
MPKVKVNTTRKGEEFEEKIYNILLEAGFEVEWRVCSLRDIETVKEIEQINKEQIEKLCIQFAKAQSEGTYVTDVIVPLLLVSLKKLPIRNTAFLSTGERQNQTSADRKGEGKQCKRPDMMFIEERKDEEEVKLWREMSDGLYWVYSGSRPDKNEFGIAGEQIAGDMFISILLSKTWMIYTIRPTESEDLDLKDLKGEVQHEPGYNEFRL